jgi:hypothetical protein
LACPLDPPDKADDLLHLIESVCEEIGRAVRADIECIRADQISTPGTIHSDIWKHLQLADVLIFDLTGGNGNVLLELGVAAACRSQDSIIILRDKADTATSNFLFDIAPSRHFLYSHTWTGLSQIRERVKKALIHALTPAPYRPTSDHKTEFPLKIDLRAGDCADLLSPPMLHRRIVDDGLEFGSLYDFRHSWLTVGDEDHAVVNLEATLRFSDRNPKFGPTEGWIGIALRSQHFFADYGHLVFVRPDGSIRHTEPHDESQPLGDVEIDSLKGFTLSQFVTFRLSIGPDTLRINVNEASKAINLKCVASDGIGHSQNAC